MEHRLALSFRTFAYAFAALCILMATGCKKAIPDPETLDPIYADLFAQKSSLDTKIESQKKKIEELRGQIEKLEPRDPVLKRTQRDKENLERGLVQLQQESTYFEIRAEQRKLYDREAYLKAFDAGKDWPPPEEFKSYKESKKLRTASRNWDDKVPKSTQYNKPVFTEKKKKEEPAKSAE